MLDHLVRVHGRRRIAMIRGSETHGEARFRHRIWSEVLEAHGLPSGPELTVLGDFNARDIDEHLADLLRTSGGFDALFCVNDRIALAAIQALRRAGLRVPEDVAVCGFDDIPQARLALPPVTTVHQPIGAQVRVAFRLLLDLMAGRPVEPVTTLESFLVIRGSCGCPAPAWSPEPEADLQPGLGDDEPAPGAVQAWLESRSPGSDAVVDVLETWDRRNFTPDPGTQRLVHQYLRGYGNQRLVTQQWRANALTSLVRYLSVDLSDAELHRHLSRTAAELGIVRGLVAVVPGPGPGDAGAWDLGDREIPGLPEPPPEFRVLVTFGSQTSQEGPYPARQLTPGDWWTGAPAGTYAVLPLVVEPYWFGVLVANLDRENSVLIRGLQEQLASHFYRKYRFQLLMAENLEKELGRQVEEEKMRALTTLVIGVAHELNTPIGNSVTVTSFLEDELRRAPGGPNGPVKEALTLLWRNLEKADALVKNFKKVATWHSEDLPTEFDLVDLLTDTVRSVPSFTESEALDIRTEFVPILRVKTMAAPFWDVLLNLLTNVRIHAYPAGTPAPVRVGLWEDAGGQAVLTVEDSGRGIAPADLPRILEPFFTTRRGEGGAGLGLHIVYNLVTQALAGSITCESQPGHGTKFTIRIPTVHPGSGRR
jgi:signal transduction histidine kinase